MVVEGTYKQVGSPSSPIQGMLMSNKQPDSEHLITGHKPGRGRPNGSRNKKNLAYDALAANDAERIIAKVVHKAVEGDMNAAQIILNRLWRPPRDRTVKIDLPPVAGVADVPRVLSQLLEAVAGGEITPAEGQSVASIIDRLKDALALTDIDQRIQRLEAASSGGR